MPSSSTRERPLGLAVLMVMSGVLGLVAAVALTVEKFDLLSNPDASLSCDFSILVQCSANLSSPQGAVFGFPNPLIGIAGFAAVIAVGLGVLGGARFDRWFWLLVNAGLLFAIAFVGWLITQSIFVIGTLCPWCMVVWAATIPLVLAVTLHNVRSGVVPLPRAIRRIVGGAYAWTPFITLLCYIGVAVLAQVNLDVLSRI